MKIAILGIFSKDVIFIMSSTSLIFWRENVSNLIIISSLVFMDYIGKTFGAEILASCYSLGCYFVVNVTTERIFVSSFRGKAYLFRFLATTLIIIYAFEPFYYFFT